MVYETLKYDKVNNFMKVKLNKSTLIYSRLYSIYMHFILQIQPRLDLIHTPFPNTHTHTQVINKSTYTCTSSEPRLDLTLIVHVATTPKRKMIPRYGNHMSLNTIGMVLKLAQNGKELTTTPNNSTIKQLTINCIGTVSAAIKRIQFQLVS